LEPRKRQKKTGKITEKSKRKNGRGKNTTVNNARLKGRKTVK